MHKSTARQNGNTQKQFFIRQNKPAEPFVQHSFRREGKSADPSSTLYTSRYPMPFDPGFRIRVSEFFS
ncbi:MAG: hypothetical protein ICV65_00885 [Flavisolibacter sp.]|nr:hypothetical protein [Flavisolibacter sp.]